MHSRAQEQVARDELGLRRRPPAPDGDGHARRRRHHLLERVPRAPLPLVQPAHLGVPQRHRPQALRAGRSRPRQGVTIGWAGGVGHLQSLARWEPALRNVLRARPETRFVSVGHAAAADVRRGVPRRARSAYPSAEIEVYPASMTLFDLSIAPSAENNQFRGKSDLRWLEASAIGIPLVAHPDVYPDIEDGVTGVHASTPDEVEAALLRLIDDADERERIGAAAHAHVSEHRRIEVMAESWREVLNEVRDARDRDLIEISASGRSVSCRLPRLATDGDSRSHIGHPRPLHSRSSRYIRVAGGRPNIPHRGTDRAGGLLGGRPSALIARRDPLRQADDRRRRRGRGGRGAARRLAHPGPGRGGVRGGAGRAPAARRTPSPSRPARRRCTPPPSPPAPALGTRSSRARSPSPPAPTARPISVPRRGSPTSTRRPSTSAPRPWRRR